VIGGESGGGGGGGGREEEEEVASGDSLEELHEGEPVAVLLRDAGANHVSRSSDQRSVTFRTHRNELTSRSEARLLPSLLQTRNVLL